MQQEITNIEHPFLEAVKKNSGVVITTGLIVLLMGVLAIASPLVAGFSVALMVGIMFIIGGIGQLVFAIKTDKGLLTSILGILTLFVGGYMVSNLGVALASLTVFLAIYLVASGFIETFLAMQVRPIKGWGWAMFSGIISVILGAMIWNQFPSSELWAVGLIMGVRLFFSGWMLVMFGFASRRLTT